MEVEISEQTVENSSQHQSETPHEIKVAPQQSIKSYSNI